VLLDELEVTERGTPEVHAALVSRRCSAASCSATSAGRRVGVVLSRLPAGVRRPCRACHWDPTHPCFMYGTLPPLPSTKAAVLWSERPGQRLRAEQQFEIATEFDRRFGAPDFVRDQRRWPPRLVAALERFLELQ
jgi:hypothetical protein